MKEHLKVLVLSLLFVFLLINHGYADSSPAGNQLESPYVKGELLVKFKPGTPGIEKSTAHAQAGSKVLKEFRGLGIQHVKLRKGQSVEEALAFYQKNPNVEFAEPNYLLQQAAFPSDPNFHEQWNLHNVGQKEGVPDADIDAPEAWDITTGSSDVVVAVLDSGIDYLHPDLKDNLWVNEAEYSGLDGVDDDGNGYVDDIYGIDAINKDSDPWDDNGHGTMVAGVIGAKGDNGVGVAGINWNVKVLPCKFIGSGGWGLVSDAVECFEYVRVLKRRGVNIVATNNSYIGEFTRSQYDAIDAQRDILCIAGAGNGSEDIDLKEPYKLAPASLYLPNVITVGASTRTDARAWFSNWGRRSVHLTAPGYEILTTLPGGKYQINGGTSLSTPHVSGVAALLKAADPGRDWREIKNLILAGGDLNSDFLDRSISGKRLNAFNAITCLDRPLFSALVLTEPPIYNSDAFPLQLIPGTTYVVSALSINCGQPVGPVSITEHGSGRMAGLLDDGIWPDRAEGDGIFSGIFVPTLSTGPLVMSSPVGMEVLMSDLQIITGSLPPGEDGEPYRQVLASTGGVLPYEWSIAAGSLPDGLTLDAATGEISGVPLTGGRYSFKVKVTDSAGAEDYQGYILTINPLRIDSPSAPAANRGTFYSFGFTAIGGEEPLTWEITSGSLPDGLSLDSETGVVSGVPTTAGEFSFTVRVTDSVGAMDERNFSIWVHPFRITMSSLKTGRPGIPYSGFISVNGGFQPIKWELVSGGLPPGLTLDTSTGEISGIPLTVQESTAFYFTVKVTDSTGESDQRDCRITIHPMWITTEFYVPNALIGMPYSLVLSAEAGFPPYTWSASCCIRYEDLTVGETLLPDGLTLNPVTGEISGVPTTAGGFYFKVRATDTEGGTDEKTFKIIIESRLWLSTPSLPDGITGQSYNQSLTAVGGVTPYKWSIISGALPGGLSLDETTGTISGVPTRTGTFMFEVQVIDALSEVDSRPFKIVVNNQLEINTSELPSGTLGLKYAAHLKATGGPTPYTWSITSGALPDGLSLDEVTGTISGIPTSTGTFTFDVQVVDAMMYSRSKAFTIIIYDELKILKDSISHGYVDYMYYEKFEASGGLTPYKWSISGDLPLGVSFTNLSAVISGTPDFAGAFTFTVRVVDARNVSTSKTFTIIVYDKLMVLTDALHPGIAGSAYEGQLYASGGLKPYKWYIASGALPDGLILDSATGTISGIPTLAGTFTLTIRVIDDLGISALRTITITIYDELQLLNDSLSSGIIGSTYEEQLYASGGLSPYIWSITSGNLPDGLGIDSGTGVISGTPSTTGTFAFTARVTDAKGETAERAFSISVYEPLLVETSSLSYGVTGRAYSQSLSASGGLAPYGWAIVNGVLPDGMALDAAGAITGTPGTAGTFAFTARVTDANNDTAQRELSISVYEPLELTTADLPYGAVEYEYHHALEAAGGLAPYRWAAVNGTMPGGLSLDAETGEVWGTPKTRGVFSFTVEVTDANGERAAQAFSLLIGKRNTYHMLPASGCRGKIYRKAPVHTTLGNSVEGCAVEDTVRRKLTNRTRDMLAAHLENGGYTEDILIQAAPEGCSLSFLTGGQGATGYVHLVEVDPMHPRKYRVLATVEVPLAANGMTYVEDISSISGTVRAGYTWGIVLSARSSGRDTTEVKWGEAGGGPGMEQWLTVTELPLLSGGGSSQGLRQD